LKKTLLLISHSSELTGGSEDNFERILKHFYKRFDVIGVYPKGKRVETFRKYTYQYTIVPNKVFPINRFSLIQYFEFLWKSMGKLYKIFCFLNDKKVDICLLNSSVSFIEIIPLLYYKIPFVIYIREKIFPYIVEKLIFKFINFTAFGIVVNSKYTMDDFINVTKNKNIELIYSTIDEQYCNYMKYYNSKLSKNKESFTVLNIGSIYDKKNQKILIHAINEIREIKGLKVKIVGKTVDKSYYDSMIELINKHDLNNIIQVVGELNKSELIKEIINSDCIVITSKEESFSLVLLEALFFEKPVISTYVGIIREVINHNVNGFIFEDDDQKTLARYILELKNNDDLYNKFEHESRKTYNKYFATEVSFNKYEEYIFKCLNKVGKLN